MKTKQIFHKSNTRGHADYGWLNTHHTFSFSNYYDAARVNFGALRVLNDDIIAGGTGFDTHPHDNMEIISIPLEGALKHRDCMGNTTVIHEADIQVMSAGTGIQHSEFNYSPNKSGKFLQIWVFPNKRNVTPRYGQTTLNRVDSENKLQQIVSPNPNDQGLWIHQDAWFHLGNFSQSQSFEYRLKKEGNGIYLFVIEGVAECEGQTLESRDGLGIWDTDSITITAKSNLKILIMEVPMNY